MNFPIITPSSRSAFRWGSSAFWLTFLVVALVYLGTTGALPILGKDEPRYVQIGREMFQSGDWITPRLGGHTWFEKPVLLYWMVAGAFQLFGVSEWSARLGAGLCGLGTVALVWWMIRPVNPKWANWSALSLASSIGLLAYSHAATFDIVLTFCTTLSLAALFRAQIEPDPKRARQFLALFWIGTGLAFLAKGLVAFLFTLLSAGLFRLIRGRTSNSTKEAVAPVTEAQGTISLHKSEWKRLNWAWGLPLCLAVSALWYVPVTLHNGWSFIHEFFVEHHFARYLSDKYQHTQPFYFYAFVFPITLLPWTPFWVSHATKTRLWALREPGDESRLKAFAWAWLLFPLVFFSASGSKLPSYILPALPGAFVLTGWSVARWLEARGRNSLRWSLALGLLGLMLGGGSLVATTRVGVALAERESVRTLFRVAENRGYNHLRVVQFDTLERAAQFYAAGRLMYGADGEPLRLDEPEPVAALARREPLLVLTLDKHIARLEALDSVRIERLASDGHVALVRLSR